MSIGRDSTRTIGGNETVQIGGQGEEPGNLDVHVSGNERRVLDKDHEFEAENACWQLRETLKADATHEVRVSCAPSGTVLTMSPKAVSIEAPESIKLRVGTAELELTPRGVFISGKVMTATVDEQMWLTSEAGRVLLDGNGTEVFGGKGSESTVRLRAGSLVCEAKGSLAQTAKSVSITSESTATLEGATTQVVGSDTATLKGASVGVTGASVDIHSEGLVDVVGKPIHLNC